MDSEANGVRNTILQVLKEFVQRGFGVLILAVVVILGSAICAVLAPYIFSSTIDSLTGASALRPILAGFTTYAVIIGLSLTLDQAVK